MTWMPINREELSSVEQQLGIGLPAGYKARLSDPRVVAMLSHRAIGAMWPGLTMQTFVDATLQLRRATTGFPPDGASCPAVPRLHKRSISASAPG